ncbi:hypothetical protein GCM10010166_52240 [Couchioplanes caeruleus subsp. azureus]|nr:hypothetical protein GCM10010166_52240 [Couchioplanes caeruleus subsp. azureus]
MPAAQQQRGRASEPQSDVRLPRDQRAGPGRVTQNHHHRSVCHGQGYGYAVGEPVPGCRPCAGPGHEEIEQHAGSLGGTSGAGERTKVGFAPIPEKAVATRLHIACFPA